MTDKYLIKKTHMHYVLKKIIKSCDMFSCGEKESALIVLGECKECLKDIVDKAQKDD
jgi:hypothetical protein